jgi:transposase-like protein
LDRSHLLRRRHQIQSLVEERLFLSILSDLVTEADEMYQNAGEKGIPHRDPNDPPRRRANSRRGRGSWDNDRPAVVGVAGREHQTLHLRVCRRTNRETLEPFVESHTVPGCHLYTDQWRAYGRLGRTGRVHKRVYHAGPKRDWTVDADGDGIREVHCNTLEGLWTGLRNHLRMFRGVSKKYLNQYVAVFEWAYRFRWATDDALRMMLIPSTPSTT